MAYTPNTWVKGDTITSAKMNHMEAGISHAEEYVDRIQGAIDELEAGSLSAVGAAAGATPVADGNGTWTWKDDPVAGLEKLLVNEIPGTTQTVTFDANDNPTTIIHSANGNTVRTDVLTWAADEVEEVRTLATGEYITITTDLTTLETTISDIEVTE